MRRAGKWLRLAAFLGVAACAAEDPATMQGGGHVHGGDGDGDGDGETPTPPNNPNNPNNPGPGGGDGDGDGDAPVCENLVVTAQPLAPDMLIVLDRSSSMLGINVGGSAGVDRWNPSITALKSVTEELQSVIRFGLLTFPPRMGGDPICGVGRLEVPIEGGNADEIARALNENLPLLGFTPTDAALREALNVLGSGLSGPDVVVRPKYVLLVTDGEPGCVGGFVDPAMVTATNNAIKALYDEGIKTYVVGYDVTGAAATMNQFAMNGGTDQYIPVSSGQELEEELRKIAGQLAPCEYTLDQEPDGGVDYVHLEIDGKLMKPGEDFTLEGTTVRLQSEHCDSVQDGRNHAVEINVRCEPVIVL